VLLALERHRRGITQVDFDSPTIDGREPIRRVASRIDELRAAGYRIDSRGRRHRMAVYVLLGEPGVAAPASSEVDAAAAPSAALLPGDAGFAARRRDAFEVFDFMDEA
jgi:hypothetical protein